MGVRTKNRRKIRVNDDLYVWYVEQDYDSENYLLNIISEDKKLVLSVPLQTENAYLISKGSIFQNKKTSGRWERYRLPITVTDIVTPGVVSEIIRWAVFETGAEAVEWNGRDISV